MEKTIILGTEKSIPSSSFWSSYDDAIIISAYWASTSFVDNEGIYFVESRSVINPETGVENSASFVFENTTSFEKDFLYNDISRFKIAKSSVDEFRSTFPKHNLGHSEFAAVCTAHIFEQMGYNPWVIIHPNEKNLISFCMSKGWAFTVLSKKDNSIPQSVQEIVDDVAFNKNPIKLSYFK